MTLYILFATIAASFSSAHAVFGVQFVMVATLSALLVAAVLFYVRRHLAIVTLAIFVSAIFLTASTVDPNYAPLTDATESARQATFVVPPARVQEAGERLFQEFGCIGCHRSDGKGIGPSLTGVFGKPLTDPGCGAVTADEDYVRESILNPSVVVVAGFAPVMPASAGKVTEEQLGALIAHLKSLSAPVR